MSPIRVAIMGAGLAGMACAVILEREGIVPDVYELRHKVGARFANTEAIMGALDYPVQDGVAHLAERYGLTINPLGALERLVLHGPTRSGVIRGKLGYITVRGNHPQSLEVQLSDQSRARVQYNSYCTLDDLAGDYDVVVVATGWAREAIRLGIWETDFYANLLGAGIEGEFDPKTAEIWLDDEFAPQGYVFLLPYSADIASLTLAVPGTDGVDLERLWQKLKDRVKHKFATRDTFVLYQYAIGRNTSPHFRNMLFAGVAGGFVMPAFGFGQFTSMISGAEAALAILRQDLKSYVAATEPLRESYNLSLKLRRIFAAADNAWYDRIVSIVGVEPIQKLLAGNNLPLLKTLALAVDPLVGRDEELARH